MELTSRDTLLATLDAIDEAVIVVAADADGTGASIRHANRAFAALVGRDRATLAGTALSTLVYGGDAASVLARAARSGGAEALALVHRDGRRLAAECRVEAAPDGPQGGDRIVVVRGRAAGEAPCEHLAALARVQSRVATGARGLEAVRQTVVDAARDATGADGVALAEPRGNRLVATAVSGDAGAWAQLERTPADTLAGWCWHTHESVVVGDARTDERLLRAHAGEPVGFCSAVIVALTRDGDCPGVLAVYAGEPHIFGDPDRRLLEQAAAVFGASLAEAAERAHERERRQLLVDALPALVSYIDADRHYREVNRAYTDWFGLAREAIVGRHVRDVMGSTAYEQVESQMATALRGERVHFEDEVAYQYGGSRPVEADYIPHRSGDGSVLGLYVLVRDISDRRRAERDWLTGTWNRRVFEERLDVLFSTARRYDRPLSFLFVDIDHFKRVNDRFGHTGGDEVLRRVARLFEARVREADSVCRWGGEEFALLLPETGIAEAEVLAENLRRATRAGDFPPVGRLTVSIGASELRPGETHQAFVASADRALYRAKEAGRDCVRLARASASVPPDDGGSSDR